MNSNIAWACGQWELLFRESDLTAGFISPRRYPYHKIICLNICSDLQSMSLMIDTQLIYAADAIPPENIALNKPTWSTSNHTYYRTGFAVDGDNTDTNIAGIDPSDSGGSWLFLAVDLGARVTLGTVVLWMDLFICEYCVW